MAKPKDKVNLVRYADDFIVTAATQQLLEQKIRPALAAFLQERGLELSEQKTVITPIEKGFDFLGHTVRKFGDKLLIGPAKSKVKTLQAKISQKIKSAGSLSQEQLLRQLNPLLRGWANYFRNGAAKRTFNKLDNYVFWRLWRWAVRRHPKKSKTWVRRKYFPKVGRTKWAFSVRIQREGQEPRVLKLYPLSSTPIERHIKVRGSANPYDPQYTEYFRKRRCFIWRVQWGRRPADAVTTP